MPRAAVSLTLGEALVILTAVAAGSAAGTYVAMTALRRQEPERRPGPGPGTRVVPRDRDQMLDEIGDRMFGLRLVEGGQRG